MGKASSSKKVARAAGTGGGRTTRGRTPWTYYGVIFVIVLVGVVGTVTSRNRHLALINQGGNVAPTIGTSWHEALAIDVCGKVLPPIKTTKDPYGLTTRGDGIIYIAPTVKSAAGENATLGKFASSIGMKLNAAELQVPGGKLYQDGDPCNGKASHVYVKQFAYVNDTVGQLLNVDPSSVKLKDQQMLTIAFVPASQKNKIPPPPASVQKKLQSLAAPSTPASTTTTPPAVSIPATTTPSTTTPSTTPPTTTAKPTTATTGS
ncbi:MAG: hypothetical protein ACYC1D_02910 [Acidimicrobiales bacterium]